VPQQFDPSRPFTAESGGFDPSKPFTMAPSTGSVVAADEPDTYWAGALKGAKEGIAGGAKGFAEGMLQSPASFAKGIVSLLTTNPATTVKEAVAAIERLPDAIRSAGADPEAWGRGVGDVTGQTMIGIAGPRIVKGTAQGVANVGQAIAESPITARVAPKLVKYGTAAAGGAVGGWPGAIVGREVGADLAETLKARLESAQAPEGPQSLPGYPRVTTAAPVAATEAQTAAQIIKAGLSSGEPMPASRFMELLRQVPPNERAAILEARQAAVQGGTAPTPKPPIVARPVQAPPEAVPAPPAETAAPSPSTPQTAPAAAPAPAQAPPAAPAAAQAAPVAKNPAVALKQARDTFSAASEAPRPGELNRAMNFILWGKSPEDALAAVMAQRGGPSASMPFDPAAELLKRGIGISDADAIEMIRKRGYKR
jgi:hypothetical protein